MCSSVYICCCCFFYSICEEILLWECEDADLKQLCYHPLRLNKCKSLSLSFYPWGVFWREKRAVTSTRFTECGCKQPEIGPEKRDRTASPDLSIVHWCNSPCCFRDHGPVCPTSAVGPLDFIFTALEGESHVKIS